MSLHERFQELAKKAARSADPRKQTGIDRVAEEDLEAEEVTGKTAKKK
jgi:hypothetical protein